MSGIVGLFDRDGRSVDGSTADRLGLDTDGQIGHTAKAAVEVSDRFATAPGRLDHVAFARTDNVVQGVPRVALGIPIFYDVPGSPADEAGFAGLEPVYEKVHVGYEFLVVRDEEIGQVHIGRCWLDIDDRAVVHDIVSTVSPKEDGLLDASSRFLHGDFPMTPVRLASIDSWFAYTRLPSMGW